MKFFLLFLVTFFNPLYCFGQQDIDSIQHREKSPLFQDDKVLSLKMDYSKEEILTNTTDSTYLKTKMSYRQQDGTWKNLPVQIRARGNYRRQNCFYLPLWIKIKKSDSEGSVFENDKKLKVVLPCLKSSTANDHVVKEYLAYQIYEILSPYYFETKLTSIQLIEHRKDKKNEHDLIGVLIQDDKKLAEEYNAKRVKRRMHPNVQDPMASARNALFQFMIGNTDYSIAYLHNEKLFYIDHKTVPIPYDFDMAGLVNTSYAVVSQIKNETLPITRVTQRMYRGFERSPEVFKNVRQEFLNKESEVFEMMDQHQQYFKNSKEFQKARDYVASFYKILKDDKKFENRIVKMARTDLK